MSDRYRQYAKERNRLVYAGLIIMAIVSFTISMLGYSVGVPFWNTLAIAVVGWICFSAPLLALRIRSPK